MLKNITLSADSNLIKKAREKASQNNTTLNTQFRLWLERYVTSDMQAELYDNLMEAFSYAKPGKHFTRDEMNER